MERIKLTARFTFLNICAITSVDVIICLVWTVVDPMHWTRKVLSVDKFGTPLESQGYCTSDHWMAFSITIVGWHFFILVVALVLCYVSRHISSRFSEAKSLALVMVSQCQIFLISIPLLIIVGIEGPGSFFVRVAVIWLNDFSAVAIIFGNLMYAVHSTHISDPDVGAAIKRYTQSQHSVVTSRSEVVRIANESLKTVKNPT